MTDVDPLDRMTVGVIVERSKSDSPWIDHLWRPVAVLGGVPETAPWTLLSDDGARATFYAGAAEIELHRSDTTNYRDNLATESPLLWVVLRPTEADPPYALFLVTADPAEGEAMTEAGNDLVETVPMPEPVREVVAGFVATHHVERVFFKRQRDAAGPERGRRGSGQQNDVKGPDEPKAGS
ncbi:MAG: hypothetical protein JWN71_2176 [Xanthobacteraceae bacterium]|nr:hypothetical protein [Xanthobacteraceae bacterium]